MCGGCGGGGRAARLWEDAAGRPDAAGIRARVRALDRLLAGTRWQVRDWHGSWLLRSPSGGCRHVATLDELFHQLPIVDLPTASAAAADRQAVRSTPPAGWHVQGALVWLAAARAAGASAELGLPLAADRCLRVELVQGEIGTLVHEPGDGAVHLAASAAPALLEDLLVTAGGPRSGVPEPRRIVVVEAGDVGPSEDSCATGYGVGVVTAAAAS